MGSGRNGPISDGSPAARTNRSPEALGSFRRELTRGGNGIDPATFAGSIPQQHGIAPRVRIGRGKWFNLLWLLPIGFVLLIVAVAVSQGLRTEPAVQRFIQQYPGTIQPTGDDAAAIGFPAWVSWQHFFNLFFMVFIIRSGVQILADHPRLYWTRHSTPGRDWFRMQKAVPADPLWTAKEELDQPATTGGSPGTASFHRSGAVVASRSRCPVVAERRGVLRAPL